MAYKLDSSHFIHIEIENEGNAFKFVLPTLEDAQEWIKNYQDDWEWTSFAARKYRSRNVISVINKIAFFTSGITTMLNSIQSKRGQKEVDKEAINKDRAKLHEHFEMHWRNGWFSTGDPKMQFVLEKRAKSDSYAIVILMYFSANPINLDELDIEGLEAQIEAIVYDRKFAELTPSTKASITKLATSFERELSSLREQNDNYRKLWKSQSDSIKDRLQRHSDNLKELHEIQEKKLNDYISESQASIEAWKKAHREEINLKEPVVFWKKRQSNSFWSAMALGVVLTLALCGMGWFLVEQNHSIYEGLKIGDAIEYWRVAAMLLIAGLSFWFLRIVAKIFLSQLHAWSDAQERVTMVQTYLSLLQEEKGLSVDDRRLVLEALFRPAPTGIIKDDGVPPALFDMVTRMK